jgi:hypothetical protein
MNPDKPVLLVVAAICFLVGTFSGWYSYAPGTPNPNPWYGRFNVVSCGLLFWVLSILFK